jgi:hypothetical protein
VLALPNITPSHLSLPRRVDSSLVTTTEKGTSIKKRFRVFVTLLETKLKSTHVLVLSFRCSQNHLNLSTYPISFKSRGSPPKAVGKITILHDYKQCPPLMTNAPPKEGTSQLVNCANYSRGSLGCV